MSHLPAGAWDTGAAVEGGFLTVKQACEFLGISRTALYELLGSGLLPSAKFGRARRIPRRTLIAYAAGQLRSFL